MNAKSAVGGTLVAVAILITLTSVCISISMLVAAHFNWNVTYQREIHGHMENAYYADTPELMKEELLNAENGMHRLELTPNLYDDMRPWKHTPDRRMDYQYKHLDSVIDRCDDAIRWRESDSQGTQAVDVYEAKMQALRTFIKSDGGWSDDIAQGAFIVAHHPVVAFWFDYFLVNFFAWLVGMATLVVPGEILLHLGKEDD